MDVSTMSGHSGATTVLKLPRELLVEVISVAASVYDIARLDCACSSFRHRRCLAAAGYKSWDYCRH